MKLFDIITRSRSVGFSLLASVAAFGLTTAAHAGSVTIDLNSVDTSAGPVDATALLASYGVTITDSSKPTPLLIVSGNPNVAPDMPPNFLYAFGQNSPPTLSFTLDFASPLDSISFTGIANTNFNLEAEWTATAYSGLTALGSVGQPFGLGTFSPEPFTLTGPDITSLTFNEDGFGFAGEFSSLDDIVLNTPSPTPDATNTCALLAAALAALFAVRRRWATA
jgi:MYXO-CTERM domain-containing protein